MLGVVLRIATYESFNVSMNTKSMVWNWQRYTISFILFSFISLQNGSYIDFRFSLYFRFLIFKRYFVANTPTFLLILFSLLFQCFSPQLFLACASVLVNLSIYYHHDFLITSGTPFYVVVVVKSEPNKNRNSNFSTKIKEIDTLLE